MRPAGRARLRPWLVTGDDHEVATTRQRPREDPTRLLARRAAGYRAASSPCRSAERAAPEGKYRLRTHAWGALASPSCSTTPVPAHQACPRRSGGGSNVVGPDCADRTPEGLTMLGAAQQPGSTASLRHRIALELIVQQTLMRPRAADRQRRRALDGRLGRYRGRGPAYSSRSRRRRANPVVRGRRRPRQLCRQPACAVRRGAVAVLAAEFCGTSISSGPNTKVVAAIRDANRTSFREARSAASGCSTWPRAPRGAPALAEPRAHRRRRFHRRHLHGDRRPPGSRRLRRNAAGIPRRFTRSTAAGTGILDLEDLHRLGQGITESWCLPPCAGPSSARNFFTSYCASRASGSWRALRRSFHVGGQWNARASGTAHRGDGGKGAFHGWRLL